MKDTILIVCDGLSKTSAAEALQQKLSYTVHQVRNITDAVGWVSNRPPNCSDLIVLDIEHLDERMENTIRTLRAMAPATPLIALIPYGDERSAQRVLEAGATDFVLKPTHIQRLRHTIQTAFKIRQMCQYMEWLERRMSGHVDFTDLVGSHPKFRQSVELAGQAANSRMPVWIDGAPGTPKEQLARAIHSASNRAKQPFVSFNCQMISPELQEAMLFGKTPHNGHYQEGRFYNAAGGTLCIEEPEYLTPAVQQRLMQFLEGDQVSANGKTHKPKVDVRIICSSSSNALAENIQRNLLSYLKSVCINLPTLSERATDIPELVTQSVASFSASQMKYIRGLTPQALEWLKLQPWPGNEQQLSNLLLRAINQASGEWLDVMDLKPDMRQLQHVSPHPNSPAIDANGKVKTLRSLQEEAIRYALQHSGGCMTRAAKNLGIGRSTLYRKLDEFNIPAHISRANQTTRPTMTVSLIERS